MFEPREFENEDVNHKAEQCLKDLSSFESYKEFKENKRNIDDFIQFLEALHYSEDPEELLEYDIPFSLN